MTAKEERERRALAAVYGERERRDVKHADRPDFVLTANDGSCFGVEVTDMYPNESEARLENVPGYFDDLIGGGLHIHRDDVSELKVVEFSVTAADGTVTHPSVTGVLQERRGDPDGSRLASTIDRKSNAKGGYRADLSHVNLIVVDHIGDGPRVGVEYRARDILTPKVCAALASAPFNEVFVVSTTDDGHFYRPLRMLDLMDSFFVFVRSLEAWESDREISPDGTVELYAATMVAEGRPTYLARAYSDRLCAVSYGAAVSVDGGMSILDLRDTAPPAPIEPWLPALPASEMADLVKHHSTFAANVEFTTAMYVRSPEQAST